MHSPPAPLTQNFHLKNPPATHTKISGKVKKKVFKKITEISRKKPESHKNLAICSGKVKKKIGGSAELGTQEYRDLVGN